MEAVRNILIIIIFFLSLSVLVPAQNNFLWKVTLAVTELGHFLALFSLILFFIPGENTLVHHFFSMIHACGIVLLCYPVICAMNISIMIAPQMKAAFGPTKNISDNKALNIGQLFWGRPIPNEVSVQKFIYQKNTTYELEGEVYHRHNDTSLKPLIVVVPGGAWSSADHRNFEKSNRHFASTGFVVAAVSYRLAPIYQYPAPVDDLENAINFLKENAKHYQIDTSKIYIIGRSAGGQIALQTAYRMGNTVISGVVAIYTPADMVWGYHLPGNPRILDSRKVLSDYLGGSYDDAKQCYHSSSCVENVVDNAPPVLMIHGLRDEMVAYEHNLRLIPALIKHGVPHTLVTLPWGTHGCDYFFDSPSGQLSTYAMEWFFKRFSE